MVKVLPTVPSLEGRENFPEAVPVIAEIPLVLPSSEGHRKLRTTGTTVWFMVEYCQLWPEEVKLVWWMVLNHETAFCMDRYRTRPIRQSVFSTGQDTYRSSYTMDTPKHSYPAFVLGSSHIDYQRPYCLRCVRTVHRSIPVTLVLRAQTGW